MDEQCQIGSVHVMGSGHAPWPRLTLEQRLRLLARRYLSVKTRQRIKTVMARVMPHASQPANTHPEATGVTAAAPLRVRLQAGDRVRVRSREDIERTLNQWRQVKGCAFMGEMFQFCGTEQRVMKRVQRFVDERDAQVYKANGLVLLENVICQGTADYGPCDRSCFYFWREEWLERIDDGFPAKTGGS